jgi:hypothetical protein
MIVKMMELERNDRVQCELPKKSYFPKSTFQRVGRNIILKTRKS